MIRRFGMGMFRALRIALASLDMAVVILLLTSATTSTSNVVQQMHQFQYQLTNASTQNQAQDQSSYLER